MATLSSQTSPLQPKSIYYFASAAAPVSADAFLPNSPAPAPTLHVIGQVCLIKLHVRRKRKLEDRRCYCFHWLSPNQKSAKDNHSSRREGKKKSERRKLETDNSCCCCFFFFFLVLLILNGKWNSNWITTAAVVID